VRTVGGIGLCWLMSKGYCAWIGLRLVLGLGLFIRGIMGCNWSKISLRQ
jgi:hypothetical protein